MGESKLVIRLIFFTLRIYELFGFDRNKEAIFDILTGIIDSDIIQIIDVMHKNVKFEQPKSEHLEQVFRNRLDLFLDVPKEILVTGLDLKDTDIDMSILNKLFLPYSEFATNSNESKSTPLNNNNNNNYNIAITATTLKEIFSANFLKKTRPTKESSTLPFTVRNRPRANVETVPKVATKVRTRPAKVMLQNRFPNQRQNLTTAGLNQIVQTRARTSARTSTVMAAAMVTLDRYRLNVLSRMTTIKTITSAKKSDSSSRTKSNIKTSTVGRPKASSSSTEKSTTLKSKKPVIDDYVPYQDYYNL